MDSLRFGWLVGPSRVHSVDPLRKIGWEWARWGCATTRFQRSSVMSYKYIIY